MKINNWRRKLTWASSHEVDGIQSDRTYFNTTHSNVQRILRHVSGHGTSHTNYWSDYFSIIWENSFSTYTRITDTLNLRSERIMWEGVWGIYDTCCFHLYWKDPVMFSLPAPDFQSDRTYFNTTHSNVRRILRYVSGHGTWLSVMSGLSVVLR